MKLALVEPFISKDLISLRAFPDKSEPTHLLGMYNLVLNLNIEIEIIDAYSHQMSEEMLAKKLLKEGYTHVGFSTYDYKPCVSYLRNTAEKLNGEIEIILGGAGATCSPERMVNIVKPDWIIKNDGEIALKELVLNDFDIHALSGKMGIKKMNGCTIIESPPIQLDKIPFLRPYSLKFYNYESSPRFQKGCIGKCVFCIGAYQSKIEYRSARNSSDLLEYLVNEKKAKIISPSGPDFTVSYKKANNIVKQIISSSLTINDFRPGVRLDTLYNCIKNEPKIWKELAKKTRIHFESSIESFSFSRLERLGKNVKSKFMKNIFSRIEEIISICDCTMVLGRIALDPFVSINEILIDNKYFIQLLEKFPDNVTIGGALMNEFVPLWGTPSMANGEKNNPWAQPNMYLNPLVKKLKKSLLDDKQFRTWCNLAEQVTDFNERNIIIREILRVITEKAILLRNH